MRRIIAAVLILSAVFTVYVCCGDEYTNTNDTSTVSTPNVSAHCAILIEADSGQVIYAANEESTAAPASLTKIMTAYAVINNAELSARVKIPSAAVGVEGSSVYLTAGEILTVKELLYAVLLESANDAAVALAIHTSGSVEEFVKLMNALAVSSGMLDTNFVNPHGLSAEAHYSTAHDMARLLCTAMKNEVFSEISSTGKFLLKGSDERTARLFVNHNRLLQSCDGVIGGKTGYTKSAGRCLASYCVRNGVSLCAVTFNAPSDWSDHEKLYAFGYTLYSQFTLPCAGTYTLHICGGKTESVYCTVGEDVKLTLRRGGGEIEKYIYMRTFDFAPFEEGQQLGSLVFYRDGKKIYEFPLYAENGAEKAKNGLWDNFFKNK